MELVIQVVLATPEHMEMQEQAATQVAQQALVALVLPVVS